MSHFIFRGPLPPKSSLFKGREDELAALEELCLGEITSYAIIYGARQTGKTSLLVRLQERLPREEALCCRVDFQGLPKATTNAAFGYIAAQVDACLEMPRALPAEASAQALRDYLCQAVSALEGRRLVLMVEELGALAKDVRIDLANVFRSFFTNRYERATCQMARMMVIFAGSVEMYDLATVELSPLNNICERIYLPDLSREDALDLVRAGLEQGGAPAETAAALAAAVYEQVRGYPSLTQRMGSLLEQRWKRSRSLSPTDADAAAQTILEGDAILQHLCNTLLEEELFPAAGELLEKPPRFSRVDPEMARLELVGFARPEDGCWKARNALFERAYRGWIEQGIYKEEAAPLKAQLGDAAALAEFTKLILDLGALVRESQASRKDQEELAEKIKQLEAQVHSGQAQRSAVIQTLSDVASLAGSAATLAPLAQKALEMAGKLFP